MWSNNLINWTSSLNLGKTEASGDALRCLDPSCWWRCRRLSGSSGHVTGIAALVGRWKEMRVEGDTGRFISPVWRSEECVFLSHECTALVGVSFDIFLLSSVRFHGFHLMDDKTDGRIPRTEKRPEESDFWAFVQTMMKTESWQTDEARGDVASVFCL